MTELESPDGALRDAHVWADAINDDDLRNAVKALCCLAAAITWQTADTGGRVADRAVGCRLLFPGQAVLTSTYPQPTLETLSNV